MCLALKLRIFHRGQHAPKFRAGTKPKSDQVVSGDERRGANLHRLDGFVVFFGEAIERQIAVAGKAVHAMQQEMLVESIQAEEAFEGGGAHLLDIGKAHVIGDQRKDLLGIAVGHAKAAADFFGHANADLDMAIEADAVGRAAEGGRLADVVQQRSPGEGCGASGGQLSEQHQGVGPDVSLRMILRRLLDAAHAGHFRQNFRQKAGRVQQLKGAAGGAFGQHAGQLVAHALAAHLFDSGGHEAGGLKRARLDLKTEPGRKAHRPQHAQLVFLKAPCRFADRTHNARLEVAKTIDKIKDGCAHVSPARELHGVEQHAVDGEVAAEDVLPGGASVMDGVWPAAIAIAAVTAEGSDFGKNFRGPVCFRHQHDTEVSAHGEGAGKHPEHTVRGGAGGDIEVGGLAAQQEIAHASAGEICGVAGSAEMFDNARGRLLTCRNWSRTVVDRHKACPWSEAGGDEENGGCQYHGDMAAALPSNSESTNAGLIQSGLILGIESSCDETAAAVVRGGAEVRSNIVASQIHTHARYGGVVPELASREHLQNIVPVVRAALEQAGCGFGDLDALAVTEGPGLAGALLVGVMYAKGLAYALNKPLVAVNHLEGHIHAVLLEARKQRETLRQPTLALVVSGGHTHLYLAEETGGAWRYRNVGRTVDDAAGEAFDKVAKLLGLGYPGGPWIDWLAQHGDPRAVIFGPVNVKQKLYRAAQEQSPRLLFSFSGLKTAVLRHVQTHGMAERIEARRRALNEMPQATAKDALPLCDTETLGLIASFQRAVVDDLARKTFAAAEQFHSASVVVSGGVAANRELRERFAAEGKKRALPVAFPSLLLSTDNAAMIAAAAWPKFLAGDFATERLSAEPSLALG